MPTGLKPRATARGGASPAFAGEVQDLARHAEIRAEKAHRASIKAFSKQVETLVEYVGASAVAYIAGVKETRAVREWIAGERNAHPTTKTKLRIALQVAELLNQEGEGAAIDSWFQGLNPSLNNHAPAELLRDAEGIDLPSKGREILAAAQEFADS